MPHENVNSSSSPVVTDTNPDGSESTYHLQRVQVIWKPATGGFSAYDTDEDGYVQVMSEWLDSDARMPSAEVVGPDANGEYHEGDPTWATPCTGFAVQLSREDINHLIRKLRRARDAAFGADA